MTRKKSLGSRLLNSIGYCSILAGSLIALVNINQTLCVKNGIEHFAKDDAKLGYATAKSTLKSLDEEVNKKSLISYLTFEEKFPRQYAQAALEGYLAKIGNLAEAEDYASKCKVEVNFKGLFF